MASIAIALFLEINSGFSGVTGCADGVDWGVSVGAGWWSAEVFGDGGLGVDASLREELLGDGCTWFAKTGRCQGGAVEFGLVEGGHVSEVVCSEVGVREIGALAYCLREICTEELAAGGLSE